MLQRQRSKVGGRSAPYLRERWSSRSSSLLTALRAVSFFVARSRASTLRARSTVRVQPTASVRTGCSRPARARAAQRRRPSRATRTAAAPRALRARRLRSLRFFAGSITVLMPARMAASTFSLMPPTGSTSPRSVISPVIAVSLRHRPVGEQRGERHEHRDARARSVLRDRAGRHVDVDVALLEAPTVDAEAHGRATSRA